MQARIGLSYGLEVIRRQARYLMRWLQILVKSCIIYSFNSFMVNFQFLSVLIAELTVFLQCLFSFWLNFLSIFLGGQNPLIQVISIKIFCCILNQQSMLSVFDCSQRPTHLCWIRVHLRLLYWGWWQMHLNQFKTVMWPSLPSAISK